MKGLEVVIVTGMSGAGKTVALKVLEDMNYFVVDNVPYSVVSRLLKSVKEKELKEKKLALGMDVRSFGDIKDFHKLSKKIESYGASYTVLYLDAEDSVILNRFNLSRRKHPMPGKTLLSSIEREREVMGEVLESADIVIDTSYLKPMELGRKIRKTVFDGRNKELVVHFQSFGFRYGIPIDLDLMFDVRCLPNPHYIEKLRPQTGNDAEVRDFVMNSEASKKYYSKLEELLAFLIPNFIAEGKSHLSIGVGCTGGKHRSVTFINYLADRFKKDENLEVIVSHREEERGNWLLVD